MAAEVPAETVLCEAMEYLSRLGTNLHTRSVNLRDRKIRPGKLKNTLAVQKAANKVLLICEVSKKSLQNVETGVKKILEIMHSSQTSNRGGKSSQSASSDKNVEKCYYFKYKSRTLRIKNKISLKHYTSVKIIATNMPNSIIDKYPVYYDCKLYRLRKKEKPDCDKKRDSDTNASDERNEKPRTTNESKSDHERHNFNPVCDVKQRTGSKKKWKHVSIINDSSDDDQISCDTKNDNVKAVLGPTSIKDSNDYILLDQPDNADTLQDCTDKESGGNRVSEDKNRSKSRDQVKKQWKHVNLIDDSSDDDRKSTDTKKDDSKEITGPTSPIKDSDNCNELDQPGNAETLQNSIDNESCQNIDKKDKNSSKSNDQENKPVIKCVSLSKLLKPDILKTNDSIIVIDDSPVPNKKTIMKHRLGGPSKNHTKSKSSLKEEKINEKEFWAQKRKEVAAFVSKKFSINLIRLPELTSEYLNSLSLKKITQNGFTVCEIADSRNTQFDNSEKLENCINETISDSETHMNDALIAEANKIKSSLLNMSDSDDSNLECNLTRKSSAKKVGTNKSDAEKVKKLLSIGSDSNSEENVEGNNKKSRDLLSQDANQQENEIGKNGNSTIYNNSLEVNPTIKPLMDEAEPKIDSEQVKKSLLVDSDSNDNVEPHIEDIIETSKTHSEAVCHEDETQNDDEKKAKNSNKQNKEIWNEGNYELKDKTPEKETSNTIGSDSELMNTPLSQRKKSASLTPQSKKKRMRESIEAKKMLLTHSSSSDTEDEQLRNALNEIKKSLLHGTDDEESSTKQVYQNQTKDSSSSTSDADVAKPKKRLRFSSSSSEESNRKKKCYREEKSSRRKMVRSKSKPGNCSSQNSDAHDSSDKDIDGLTNLDTLNKMKNRRRNSENSDTPEDTIASRPRRKPKPSGLICEEILKAETSSDAASGSADENEDCDGEVPTVTVPSFNGDGGHLVKEDLLGESDSSSSHNDESNNKEESEDDEKINSKRKKGILSSDSEVGSSRKKDTNVKSSDFEESDDDTEPSKRSKRKKVAESDASESGSSVDGSKKKRKRIKPLDSDVSGSDSENEGRNKHGRKNIRKVMGKNQLEEATKKAAREEKERIARIAERQKMYNNLEFDESGKPDEVVLEKVVLDFDPETKEPLIEVDRGLVKKLKPHQANGIKFMWDACFESAKRIKKDKGSGCILAHCMGLGKTLQVVTLTHTLLTHGEFTGVNRVLVVCPLSTVLNWVNEFNMWLKHAEADNDVDVYELSRFKQNSERAYQLSQWFTHGGVCVLGYEMFRNLSADNVKKFKKKMLKNFQESLVDPGPDLVVCDEGHLLKNEKTSLSQSMNRVKTLRRIVLTGTPLQNNLKEYYCMVQFVKPNLLGKYNEYLNRFVNPITNGQYTDSTEHDIKIMKRRSHVLHKMLDGAVQRRDYGVLAPFLPPKHEYVLFITLSEVQVKLYQHYLDNFSRRPQPGKSSGFLFPDFQSLQRIWTHPLVLKYNSERYEIMQQKKREREEEDSEGSLVDFIDDDSTPDESSTEESSDDSSIMSDDSRKKSKKKKSAKKSKGKDAKGAEGLARPRRGTRANPIDLEDDVKEEDDVIEVRNENPTEWWIKLVSDDELEDMRNSHKLILLFDILRQCDTIGDKLLVFSQSLYSLDLIEHFLGKVDEATQDGRIDEKLGGHVGSWSPGIDYFRLDGSTSCENRSIWCKNFNREDNPRARLFLISTRAGGLGINLVAANRVVIFDVSWNPSHDVQSIFRVYRFGQKKPCYVYRFLAMGTMEEKIYERQVTKQAISKRVIDEQQIDRHYAENDLAELYKFEPQPPVPRPIPPLPKDRLFAEMLREHEAQIYKYHEHDSLLENKEEETLSEEERKAAWEDFENEKNKPPPAPFPSPWPMHNGMMSGLLAQQQQQLAYAALAAMIRKDMPNVNDNQIRDMVPMLYNSNPQIFGGYDYGLMQKMSEMYKYTMNPMMNPGVMNPASGPGGMGSMSGASGLQYEPPWQRQQQQQQQMRLQQLMQQQNQMGAKFYAGGLGSRDPIAMALQQQRAREIMLGTSGGGGGGAGGAGAGRPRGRPPLQPRVPPPAHAARAPPGDVVNLDSD